VTIRGIREPIGLTWGVQRRPLPAAPARATRAAERPLEQVIVRSALKILLLSIVLLAAALLAWRLRILILLILVSTFVAVLLNPFVRLLRRRGVPRTAAAILVYLALVLIGAAMSFVIVHPLYSSAIKFAKDLPHLIRQAQHGNGTFGHLITRLHLASYIASHAPQLETQITHLSRPALAVGKSVVGGVVSVVTIAFLSFFLVLEVPSILAELLGFLPEQRASAFRRTADAMASQVTGFMLGDLATSLIAGLVIWVTLLVTGVPFAGVLAIWVALVDFLPLIGGLLAGVPTVGLAFLHSVPAGIVTVIVFLVYQQVENHILYPIIVSRTVKLNPLFVLLAVLVGAETGSILGSTFGALAGALLAVPAAGSVQVGLREFLRERHTGDS
jgi:predicted PurR-regulated permease PerM